MNPVRPATYKVIRHILAHPDEALIQREIQRQTGVSVGQVNKVVNWLVSRGYLKKFKQNGRLRGVKVPTNSVELVNPGGLVTLFGLYRQMEELLIYSLEVRGDPKVISEYLREKGAVFCLDTALGQYSSYFRNPGIFCYVPESIANQLKNEMQSASGGGLTLEIYRDDIDDKSDYNGHYTTKLRTVLDLACSTRFYAARTLLSELWGIEFEG